MLKSSKHNHNGPGAPMNRNELRKADINLMVVFEALMQERNLTRAAEKLFVAQPTVSAALARLRAMFNDPLLIRVGNRMEPSARAQEVIKHLTPALDAMSVALSLTHDFDPLSSKMTFRIGLSDDVESGLLPPLLRALRVEAPNVVVVVQHVDYWRIPDLLAAGDVTVGISQTRGLPANAKRKVLRSMQARVVRADKSTRALTLDEFCARPHVQVSPTANTHGVVDDWLKELGRERQVVLSVPQFSTLPAILAGTELLACCPDYAAQGMERWGNLQAEQLPFAATALELAMVWLSTTDNDPAERWLRGRLEHYMGGMA
ncbi:LysR substrate-binding domain-containing protein [Pseudomonas juntendi]|uniref:LysR substrate-binding domain-containing protein n=3 Tax=Gammaproteobacteria TaxID=1236 RepID=A0ABZ2J8R3_9PSED|nr:MULTISPECIES: LysR substrate-binding domain-containing protein [Pseudomonas]MDM3889538.1 LysR substrate-binding domain-containing protein [Pseudomonas juntendi]WHL28235.1 LysR substrate-binding domain-containing protein [Pseudomonas juntendi]